MLLTDPALIPITQQPYPHVALVPALSDYAELAQAFPDEARFGDKIRMHGDLTYPDVEYCRLLDDSPAYGRLHQWVYSPAFIEGFLTLFDRSIGRLVDAGDLLADPRTLPIRAEPFEGRDIIGFNQQPIKDSFLFPRLDIGIGRRDYGRVNGGRGVHVDNMTRLISILIFIDDNPTMVGGEHRLYALDGVEPRLHTVYRPSGNLMVASLQSNLALHDVNPVTQIVGVRKAMYLAVSCSAEIWRPQVDPRLQKLTKNRYRKRGLYALAGKAKRKLDYVLSR